MRSKIYMGDLVQNKDRQFGAATVYYPAVVVTRGGERRYALFTRAQLRDAMERADKNPEDMPRESLLSRIF